MIYRKKNTLIVLARKYNDIYYALSTQEWNEYKTHILLIIPSRADADSFPLQDKFELVRIIPDDSGINTLRLPLYMIKLRLSLSGIKGDAIMMSNPEMFVNRVIYKLSGCRQIIFLEDGLMNYYQYKSTYGYPKRILSYIFSVNNNKYLSRIKRTYLTFPDLAVYYFGEKSRLSFDNLSFIKDQIIKLPNLSNKKIFVSQNILNEKNGEYDLSGHNSLFNNIVNKFKIDYYVPRAAKYTEVIEGCEILDINKYGVTLEVLATFYNFELYGFSTSLIFTLKNINPNIITHRISSSNLNINVPDILEINTDITESMDD